MSGRRRDHAAGAGGGGAAPELDPRNVVEGAVTWTDLRDSVPAFDPSELFGGE